MYQLRYFDKALCYIFKERLHLLDENICDTYSIWQFYPQHYWDKVKYLCSGEYLCPPLYFSLVYWLVLFISFMGCIYSLYEFTSLLQNKCKHPTIWRHRQFRVLTFKILRRCRLVGAVVMFNAWILLILATVTVTPDNMEPWLKISTYVLVFECFIWCIEVIWGVSKFELMTLFSFILFILNILCVRCIQGVFYSAIESNNVKDLILWEKY